VGIDGYFFRAADTHGSVFGATITQVRALTSDPVLLAETAVGPFAGAGKIAELFAGAREQITSPGSSGSTRPSTTGSTTRTGAWPTAPRGWRRSATPVKPLYPNVPGVPSPS
jgi:hypothetical protein